MKEFSTFYDNIVRNGYSFGTGVWSVIDPSIKMFLDEYGVYKPNIDNYKSSNISSEVFEKIKSVTVESGDALNEDVISKKLFGDIDGVNYNKELGYYKSLYAGHVTEGNFRENASSGGFGTWIFKELLDRQLIEGVIHVKQAFSDSDNVFFKYGISRTVEEICAGSKTKYYPVELSEVLSIVKSMPGRYAIIGIPSFISSVRLLAEEDEIFKERILFTIGLICGHQKSSKFSESLAWQCGINPKNVTYMDFRHKMKNEVSSNYGVLVKGYIDNKEVTVEKKMSELVGSDWGHGFFKTKASDFTDDVMNETADVTLGDAWLPEYVNDSNGNNVILIRNPIIEKIIEDGIKSKKINVSMISPESMFQSQAAHYRHTRDELSYRLFKKDKHKEWRPKKRVESSNDLSIFRKKVQDWREIIARQSHIKYKEAVEKNDFSYYKNEMSAYTKKYNFLYKMKRIQRMGLKKFLRKLIIH